LPTTVDWRFVRVLFLVTIKIWGEGRGYYWGRGYLSKTKNKFNDKILNELTAFYNYWSNDKE